MIELHQNMHKQPRIAATSPHTRQLTRALCLLQSRVHSLQQMVTERDAEISQLRQKVQSGGTRDAVRAPERQSSASNPEKDVDVAKRQVDHLRHILDANSLWDGDASGEAISGSPDSGTVTGTGHAF